MCPDVPIGVPGACPFPCLEELEWDVREGGEVGESPSSCAVALRAQGRDICFHQWFGGGSPGVGALVPTSLCPCCLYISGCQQDPSPALVAAHPPSLAFLGPESVSKSGMLTQLL